MKGSVEMINELLIYAFNNISRSEKYMLENSEYKDLSVSEIHILEAVGQDRRTMTEVAKRVGITVGSLTMSVNRIVHKGYLIRDYDMQDRRYVYLKLTALGKRAYELHESFHSEMVKNMLEQIEEIDCEVLIESLERLVKFFKDEATEKQIIRYSR